MEDKTEQTTPTNSNSRHFDLTSFSRAKDKMIATNDRAYANTRFARWERFRERQRDYTAEEVEAIVKNGSLTEQQTLSRYFFNTDGYYKHVITHYATLLRFMGLLIPNPSAGKSLSTSHIQKRYFNALDFVEAMNIPTWLTHCALRALIDGCYYGVRVDTDKNSFSVLDLPAQYCRTRFKDTAGNDLIEFDLAYFDTITCPEQKEAALTAYPKILAKAYRKFKRGSLKSSWFIVPSDIGICIPIFDGRPVFLSTIPAIMAYDEAVANRQEKEAEDIRKIIVQQIPHLADGRLLFEPDEAEEIHVGTVNMLKGNQNISVLTTYADVESVASHSADEDSDALLQKAEQNIYAQAGVSGQIFAATSSTSIEASLQNDLAFMMHFANKASIVITNVVNEKWSNSNISFKYTIVDVSYYNKTQFILDGFKLVGSGYSIIIPALAQGISQRDLVNVKDLENDVLHLRDKLKPLATAYTQSATDLAKINAGQDPDDSEGEAGRPELDEDEKSEKTIKNEQSNDKTGGGS